jgi:hypothetical protein
MSLPEAVFYRHTSTSNYGQELGPLTSTTSPQSLGAWRGPVEVGEYRLVRTFEVTLTMGSTVTEKWGQ